MSEQLNALWNTYRETPFLTTGISRKLPELSTDALAGIEALLKTMSDSGETKDGYRVKRVASNLYKLIALQQGDDEKGKGKSLINEKESLTGDFLPTVPSEMKALRQWVIWLYHLKDGKPSKILYQCNGWAASTASNKTWTDYQKAVACCRSHREASFNYRYRPHPKAPYEHHTAAVAGVGFVFSESDPYCGIDLDVCLDDSGNIKPWAQPVVDMLKPVSYGEVSPSGNGIKFWTRAMLPQDTEHKVYIVTNADAIEVYDQGRFFTVTGRGKGTILDGQDAIDWLLHEYFTTDIQASQTEQPHIRASATTAEIIAHIRASKRVHKFNALMNGNTTGYGSQSEADLALCALIAFWTQHPTMIDEIFRQSTLYRPKWDEPHRGDKSTYGQMTIETALSGNRETHQPPTTRKPFSKTKQRLNKSRKLYGDNR